MSASGSVSLPTLPAGNTQKLKVRLLFSGLVLALLLGSVRSVSASGESPPHWPWRGVSVNTVSATPEMVSGLLDKLPINAFRLQLHACQLARDAHIPIAVAWDKTLEILPAFLRVAQQRGVMVVINVSKFCLGGDQRKESFWLDDEEQQRIYGMVDRIIDRTAGFDRLLIAYDFFSEPLVVSGFGIRSVPPEWNSYLSRLVRHIRERDATSWIVVSAGPGMSPSGYVSLQPVVDAKVVYNVHMYLPTRFTHQGLADIPLGPVYPGSIRNTHWDKEKLRSELAVVREFQMKYSALVWVGEFGALRWAKGSERYLEDLVDIFEGYGWGWAYFSASGFHGWNPNYDNRYGSSQTIAKEQFVGEKSTRWATLRSIFNRLEDDK